MEMVGLALHDAANQVAEGYEARVRLALEASGETQPRRRLLELLAYDDSSLEWSSTDAIRLFAEAYGDREDWSFLHTALAQLTSDERGAMLKRTGKAGTYMYKFDDPHMGPYLRLAKFPRVATEGRSAV